MRPKHFLIGRGWDDSQHRRTQFRPHTRRLKMEALEDRQMLSVEAPQLDFFTTSQALFVENVGQWADESVRYFHRADGANVLHTDQGPVIQLFGPDSAHEELDTMGVSVSANRPGELGQPGTRSANLSMRFDGAEDVNPLGLNRSETRFNFFVGDRSRWRSHVPSFEIVAYEGLYAGIDLLTWGRRDHVKYEFHVAPGADYQHIEISYEGAERLWIDGNGALHVATKLGELVDERPYIYQLIDDQPVQVDGSFVLIDSDTYSFVVTGGYDADRELIIDPDLAWSTYLGGGNADSASEIRVDSVGNVYVTGVTSSPGWATTETVGSDINGGTDIFVAKLDATGSQLLYATYLGGANDDGGFGIAVDADGNALVTGFTASPGWATPGAHSANLNGGDDAFVAKLDSSGGNLLYATYLGGSEFDRGVGIAVDALGAAYVSGSTQSSNWATSGAYDTSYNGGFDAFVAKLNTDGTDLVYATYLGEATDELANDITVDLLGNAYVIGDAGRSAGDEDALVAKLNASGSDLLYQSFIGGSDIEYGNAIALDNSGNVYLCGSTASVGWATPGTYGAAHNGGFDTFVVKLDAASGSTLYATYLGGTSRDGATDITVDGSGNPVITGYTASGGWATAGAFDTTINGGDDAYMAILDSSGDELLYATFLGGSDFDRGLGIAVDGSDDVYVSGFTASSGWATAGAYDTNHNGGLDAFVAKFSDDTGTASVVGRRVFYNDSAFDDGPAANARDDEAIAPDPTQAAEPALGKTALLPGQTATFQNITSYDKGINGIMVDISSLPGTPTTADFTFKRGNDSDPTGWGDAPVPSSITVRAGEGVGGSDRVTLIWPAYQPTNPDPSTQAVAGEWLEVMVLPTVNTGLAVADVFYFGNALGDSGTGNTTEQALVSAIDFGAVRDNPHSPNNPAAIDDFVDYNRDSFVNAIDFGLVRDNPANPGNALRWINAPAAAVPDGRIADDSAGLWDTALADADVILEQSVDLRWLAELNAEEQRMRRQSPSHSAREAVEKLLATTWET